MLKSLYLVPALTLGLALAGAVAYAAPRDGHPQGGMPNDAERAAWHHEMCADEYAHGVSRMAFIETRLALTDAQRPAFDAWKNIILSDAKGRQDACLSDTHDRSGPPSAIDRETHREHMLKAQLAFLDSELPALTALYQTLTPEQKMVFDGPHHGPHEHGGGHHGHHGDDGDHGGDHEDGPTG
ncbi:MAG TPA: Spy/CpxP family protein refolding chaperone [Rhizomicrobium sp.]|jgi:hypothetical protein|nr:Spy/CpxP family protein refolding chaperone [Rhizomicrobium sp.]